MPRNWNEVSRGLANYTRAARFNFIAAQIMAACCQTRTLTAHYDAAGKDQRIALVSQNAVMGLGAEEASGRCN